MGRRKREIRPSRLQAWGITLALGGTAAALQAAWAIGPLQGVPRWIVVPVIIGLVEAALLPWGLREWAFRRGQPPEPRYIVGGFLISWALITGYVFLRWAVE